MRARLAPLLALVLLGALAFRSVHLASYELRRAILREEMKHRISQGLPEKDLVRFTFTAREHAALDLEDEGREFRLDGHLYDVVRTRATANGAVEVWAVDDRDELGLLVRLEALLEQGMDERGIGREDAREAVSALSEALPERPVTLDSFQGPVRELRPPLEQRPLRGAMNALLRPPRG